MNFYYGSVVKLLPASFICIFFMACGNTDQSKNIDFSKPEENEALSAGEATVFNHGKGAFSLPSNNMNYGRKSDFFIGNSFFQDPWVTAPATTDIRDGLGPLFNVSSCQSCHINDGRGHAPKNSDEPFSGLLIRLSRPAMTNEERQLLDSKTVANIGDSQYGSQVQDRGVIGVQKEMMLSVEYEEIEEVFTDGFTVSLRKPVWSFTEKNYGEFDTETVFSVRVAPPAIGLGFLAAIDDEQILQREDPSDSDGDGISGRANRVWDIRKGRTVIGRFGWKAGQSTIEQQAAAAFIGDMGLTSELFTEQNCMPEQHACQNSPNGNGKHGYEVTGEVLDLTVFYLRNLAVPARRNIDDESVLKGKKSFNDLGCASCHTPKYKTPVLSEEFIEQSDQLIWPYTDMLLHDMGEQLADFTQDNSAVNDGSLVEFDASGREWRTPPLWGLGLTKVVSPEATFLHDGRARTVLEAILWHGGEAEPSKRAVLQLNEAQRHNLLSFLNSL